MSNLKRFDSASIAVVIGTRHVHGRATYVNDPNLGNSLAIAIVEVPGTEILLSEDSWRGELIEDKQYGCQYQLHLDRALY